MVATCPRCGHSVRSHAIVHRVPRFTCANCDCPLTRGEINERRLEALRKGVSASPLFLGMYPCRVNRYGSSRTPGGNDHLQIADFPRYPTMREMDLALQLADSIDPPVDTVAFVAVGPHTVRRCRVCRRPSIAGPTLCDACAHVHKFKSHGSDGVDRDYVADAQYMAEYAEWLATQYMAHHDWLVAQVTRHSRTCLQCQHTDTFLLMDESATCSQCHAEAGPVMRRLT